MSKVTVNLWISFTNIYVEVKCVSALRRTGVRAQIDLLSVCTFSAVTRNLV